MTGNVIVNYLNKTKEVKRHVLYLSEEIYRDFVAHFRQTIVELVFFMLRDFFFSELDCPVR